MIVLFLVSAALHLKLAGFGWFFRYEAYLVAASLFVLSVGAFEYLSRFQERTRRAIETPLAALWVFYLIAVLPIILYPRGADGLIGIPRASRNIYEQQYQMGLFLRQFYRGAPVAANDIGAVSYLGDTRLEDLGGLGSLDVAKQRVKDFLTPEQIGRLSKARGTKMAILYESWFKEGVIGFGGLPQKWVRAGQWTIPNNYICGDATVTFFAVDPSEEVRLIASLRSFSPQLPREIVQSGPYTESHDYRGQASCDGR